MIQDSEPAGREQFRNAPVDPRPEDLILRELDDPALTELIYGPEKPHRRVDLLDPPCEMDRRADTGLDHVAMPEPAYRADPDGPVRHPAAAEAVLRAIRVGASGVTVNSRISASPPTA